MSITTRHTTIARCAATATLFGVIVAIPGTAIAAPDDSAPDLTPPNTTISAVEPTSEAPIPAPSDNDIKKIALANKIDIPALALKLRDIAIENYIYAAKNNGARTSKWSELVDLENVLKTSRLLQNPEIAKKYPFLSTDFTNPPKQLNGAGERTDLWNIGLTIFIFKSEKNKPASVSRSVFYTTPKMLEDQMILMYKNGHQDYLAEAARILSDVNPAPVSKPVPMPKPVVQILSNSKILFLAEKVQIAAKNNWKYTWIEKPKLVDKLLNNSAKYWADLNKLEAPHNKYGLNFDGNRSLPAVAYYIDVHGQTKPISPLGLTRYADLIQSQTKPSTTFNVTRDDFASYIAILNKNGFGDYLNEAYNVFLPKNNLKPSKTNKSFAPLN